LFAVCPTHKRVPFLLDFHITVTVNITALSEKGAKRRSVLYHQYFCFLSLFLTAFTYVRKYVIHLRHVCVRARVFACFPTKNNSSALHDSAPNKKTTLEPCCCRRVYIRTVVGINVYTILSGNKDPRWCGCVDCSTVNIAIKYYCISCTTLYTKRQFLCDDALFFHRRQMPWMMKDGYVYVFPIEDEMFVFFFIQSQWFLSQYKCRMSSNQSWLIQVNTRLFRRSWLMLLRCDSSIRYTVE
jgi:hypothetical protein